MSNGPSNPVNVTRIASASLKGGHAPLPGSGESAKKDVAKYAPITEHTTVKRSIPVTEPADSPEEDTNAPEAAPVEAAAEKARHAKWKDSQEAKRVAREAAKTETLAKRQGLAPVLLGKGDLTGAAKALGMQASELVTLVNQAALGMTPEAEKPKAFTPEEQRTADETAFRAEMKAFRKEQEDYRNGQTMTGYIEKTIRPVLADKDAYEMIHASGVADIETYAYRYMNEHYYTTSEKDASGKIVKPGEVLSAKDVIDAIEENLVKAAEGELERNRAVKKLGKFFAPAGGEASAEPGAGVPQALEAGSTALGDSRRARIAQAMAELQAEAGAPEAEPEAAEEPPRGDPAAPKVVRSAPAGANIRATHLMRGRLTAAEKIARARAEDEASAVARRR